MKTINLRWIYPHYRHDEFVEVSDEVWEVMRQAQREMNPSKDFRLVGRPRGGSSCRMDERGEGEGSKRFEHLYVSFMRIVVLC